MTLGNFDCMLCLLCFCFVYHLHLKMIKSQAICTQTQGRQLQIFTHVMKRKLLGKQTPLYIRFLNKSLRVERARKYESTQQDFNYLQSLLTLL